MNEIIIQLSSNILYQKRTYTKLIDALGDVGGLMEITNMIFSVICYLIVNILYNKSLVNNLFNFDLSKKLVILKFKINNKNIDTNDNNEIIPKNKLEVKENLIIKKQTRKNKIKKELIYPQFNHHLVNRDIESSKRNFNDFNEDKRKNIYLNHSNIIIFDNDDKKNKKEVRDNNHRLNFLDNNAENREKIKTKMKESELNSSFCFQLKQKRNINNILFDEGMKLIIKNLDIFNAFRRFYELSKIKSMISEKDIETQMSDECKQKLENIINKNKSI